MLKGLLRLVVVLVIVVAAGAFFLGRWGRGGVRPDGVSSTVGTSGQVNAEKAKEVGAEVGAKTAAAANRAGAMLTEGALTAKIKSKMALDDLVQARAIDVTTTGHVVTLNGKVRSTAEHDRAVQLARQTDGVTEVVDHLSVVR